MALCEGYERKIDKINGVLAQYGISSVEECKTICEEKGFDPYTITKNIQPICFEDAAWAYTVGAAIAIKKGVKTAAEAAEAIGIGLQACCIRCAGGTRPSALLSGLVTSLLPQQRAPSALPVRPTAPGRSPCGPSSTAWARTRLRSSAGSTAAPMSRPSSSTTRAY